MPGGGGGLVWKARYNKSFIVIPLTLQSINVTKQNHMNFVMIIFCSLVRLIIPPMNSTASRPTNSYHFSGNVLRRSQALRAWHFMRFRAWQFLTTFYDFSGASHLKIPCTFSGASRLRILLSRAWQGAPRLRPPWPGLDPLFAAWLELSISWDEKITDCFAEYMSWWYQSLDD